MHNKSMRLLEILDYSVFWELMCTSDIPRNEWARIIIYIFSSRCDILIVTIKVDTHRTRFGNATFRFSTTDNFDLDYFYLEL